MYVKALENGGVKVAIVVLVVCPRRWQKLHDVCFSNSYKKQWSQFASL